MKASNCQTFKIWEENDSRKRASRFFSLLETKNVTIGQVLSQELLLADFQRYKMGYSLQVCICTYCTVTMLLLIFGPDKTFRREPPLNRHIFCRPDVKS
jgi:hypothetical protein